MDAILSATVTVKVDKCIMVIDMVSAVRNNKITNIFPCEKYGTI
jgi:hypothetical protein